jgi:VWFA-related protein
MAGDLGAFGSALASLRPDGRTALYDALTEGLDHLALGTRPRKVLVVISDGGDNASEATLERVLLRARGSNAVIYTIGIFDDEDLDRNPGVLKSLARTTGGERFLPHSPGDLLQVCERIAREIRSGYTIGYVPPDRDGAYHRVRVEIEPSPSRRPTVRTRPGYFAAGRSAQP